MKNSKTSWSDVKKQFQKNWPAIKSEELEHAHGDKTALTQLIENKYSIPHAEAAAEVSEIMQGLETSPSLPDTEEQRKLEIGEKPVYPNKLYEEELPPEIQLNEEE